MGWTKTDPQGSTKVSDSPTIFQGNWTAIENWTNTEHGSLASATSGMHIPGYAGVVWTGAQSALSGAFSAPPVGSMAIASASSDGHVRLYVCTSSAGSGTWTDQNITNATTTTATNLSATTVSSTNVYATTITATTTSADILSGGYVKADTVSATTYVNLPASSLPEPLTATTFSGTNAYLTTVSGTTLTATSMCATTISATTYLNTPAGSIRTKTITTTAAPAINTDSYDCVSITALDVAITSFTDNLTGTPSNFQKLIIRIKDNGVARTLTWGAKFVAKGSSLPTTTVASKLLTVGFIYDTVATTWGCVAKVQED